MKTVIRTNAYVCATLVVILVGGMRAVFAEPRNGIELNKIAFTFAAELIKEGQVVADGKGDWTKHHPSADERTTSFAFMDSQSMRSGIWVSTVGSRRIRSKDTSFRTAISKMFIGAG